MHLLSRVDQEEKESERARGQRSKLDRQRSDFREQRRQAARVGVTASTSAAGAAQILDCLKRLLALESADHSAERRGKPANVIVKRLVLGTRAGIDWND